MTIIRLLLVTTALSGCAARQTPEPAVAAGANPAAASNASSAQQLALMTSPTNRLELRHFYRFAPDGGSSLIVTECDGPACAKEVETVSNK
jgi:hypothetical protein